MSDSLMSLDDFEPFADGLDHPEGVAWGPDGYIYAGGEAGQIYRVDLDDGSFEEIACTGGFILGLCLDADSNVYVCDLKRHAVVRVGQDGEVTPYSKGSPEQEMQTPNYPAFDSQGNLYVSDSGEFDKFNGCLFRIHPGGQTELVNNQPLPFPNGLALNSDETELYAVLSNMPGVGKFKIHSDGKIGPMEPVVELPNTVPDGVAFDVEGNLYIACYTPDVIYRLAPSGDLNILAEDWRSVTFSSPTNVTFAGEDLSTLVVSSLARWHLTKGRMPVPGLATRYPKLQGY
jgi:gluconolactonase